MKRIVLAALLVAGAQAAGYRIAGIVVNAATHQAVAGARVTLAPLERPDERLPFITGPDGRFVFAGMAAGRYTLVAERRGFLAGALAGDLVTGPDRHTESLVLPVSPPGVIAGKVTDDLGDPVYRANVQLFGSAMHNGHRRLTPVSSRQTDDTGQYRFGGLAPGSYFVSASGFPWYAKFNETHGDTPARTMTHTGYGIQYFRDTGDPAAAEPVAVEAGQEAAADFTLVPLPAVAVRVHLEGGGDSGIQYALTAAGPGGNPVLVRQGNTEGDLINLWAIPPGHYELEIRGDLYAREPITIGAVDADINVRLSAAPSLSGTVEVEGGASLPAGASILLSDENAGASQSASIGPGGKFVLQGIPPERYQVALLGAGDYYLKQWSAEGVTAIRLKAIAAKGSRIAGKVERDDQPATGALVVLSGPEESRAVRADTAGSYEIRGVPPGSYSLFAVQDGADLEYANPAAIEPYLAGAQKVKLAAGASYSRDLALPRTTADRPGPASPKP